MSMVRGLLLSHGGGYSQFNLQKSMQNYILSIFQKRYKYFENLTSAFDLITVEAQNEVSEEEPTY